MAIYHCTCKVISRGQGRSAVGAAAYRSGEALKNEYDGIIHDYSRKGGVVYSEIMLCEHAPERYRDRGALWNEVEQVEKSAKAQLCREYEMALPRELTRVEMIELVRKFVHENYVKNGMCADFAIHDKEDGNPHVHILVTMRPIELDGTWGVKQKKEYIMDKDGNKQYDKKKQIYKCKTVKTTDWDSKEFLQEIREAWAKAVNLELERKELSDRVDYRSLQEQGIDRAPTIHEGVAARAIERKGGTSERCEINREIKKGTEQIHAVDAEIAELTVEINVIRAESNWLDMYARIDQVGDRVGNNLWVYDVLQKQLARLDVLEGEVLAIEAKTRDAIEPDVAYERYQLALAEIGALRTEISLQIDTMRRLEETHIVLHYSEAAYGVFDVQAINEDYRIVEDDDQYAFVVRSASEKTLIRDVKRADSALTGMYDTYLLKKLIEENRAAAKRKEPARNCEDMLIRRIEDCFANLRFIERTGVCNITDVREALGKLRAQRQACQNAIAQAESMAAVLQASDAAAGKYMDRMKQLQEQLETISGEIVEYQRCADILSKYSRGYSIMDVPAPAKMPHQLHVEPAGVGTEASDAAYDVEGIAGRLAAYRADYIEAAVQSKQTSYKANPIYRQRAASIAALHAEERGQWEQIQQLHAERDQLGVFTGERKRKIDQEIARAERLHDATMTKLREYGITDPTGAAVTIDELTARADQEDTKAAAALESVGAADRAAQAKASVSALAKTIPEDRKQDVRAALMQHRGTSAWSGTIASMETQRAAEKELDAVLVQGGGQSKSDDRQRTTDKKKDGKVR